MTYRGKREYRWAANSSIPIPGDTLDDPQHIRLGPHHAARDDGRRNQKPCIPQGACIVCFRIFQSGSVLQQRFERFGCRIRASAVEKDHDA